MEAFADLAVAQTTTASSKEANENTNGDAAVASHSGKESAQEVTLEDEVKQIVGSVSSWWTDFSKKSQEQINAAKKEIESQGGIMSIAKKEAQKFEAQLSNAQKTAREKVQAADDNDIIGDKSTDSIGKGKSKEALQGDDGVEVDNLEEKARRKSRSDSHTDIPVVSSTGEAIFDIDGPITDGKREVLDQKIQSAKANAQVALQNVQTFWDRVQADPRLNNMQATIAKTLKNVSLPKVAVEAKEGSSEGTTAASLTFADVSKQFQTSFPHLNWKESQALAKKYYDASENVARDWGKEMSTLMGDLVRIVPPEEVEKDKSSGGLQVNNTPAAPVEKPAVKDAIVTTASTEEEDFDWDGDIETSAASNGLQTTSDQPTDLGNDVDKIVTSDTTTKTTGESKKISDDDEEESDWE